ncbi:vesicle transport V-SNARE protein amine-terminal protein (macronuclear) [Tetrahymena thermophila SB210]|uniref:Vesicle transport V-SNARE protein amine-terminal protein n=1 Tax=Tetrahymena thermophila (strain SB210) TaxID=312017 RepID=Q24E32_TETTS|nr:vesicle transport V-SNARE protein amine-terminal protein [Tetrahymena thermophila SB210]EAS06069.2 vesicle transport V-SNARE protein amine-terminal protein [Tetrahymena thermophila SB210]|eukprot:XP_001026314.2 vesicle transport V-SNARE protein amine-terminal protein [Tetrahymena thermophila SB210]
MSELFESCETEFNKIVNQIQKMLANVQNLDQNKKDKTMIDIKYELNEADLQIKQMEIEVNSLPYQTKQQLQQKIKRYRNEWDSLKKKQIKVEESINDDKRRDSLMDQKIELSDVESTGRERFIKTGAMLSDGTSKLKNALGVLYQVEDTSNQISEAIVAQNQKVGKMIQDNNDISSNLSESNRLADRIKSNIRKNKVVLYIVSLIIIIAIGIIVWLKV